MLVKLYPENPNPRQIDLVVDALRNGGIVISTDTVYGLGCISPSPGLWSASLN